MIALYQKPVKDGNVFITFTNVFFILGIKTRF